MEDSKPAIYIYNGPLHGPGFNKRDLIKVMELNAIAFMKATADDKNSRHTDNTK